MLFVCSHQSCRGSEHLGIRANCRYRGATELVVIVKYHVMHMCAVVFCCAALCCLYMYCVYVWCRQAGVTIASVLVAGDNTPTVTPDYYGGHLLFPSNSSRYTTIELLYMIVVG